LVVADCIWPEPGAPGEDETHAGVGQFKPAGRELLLLMGGTKADSRARSDQKLLL
jgi:hypothetical protein